MLVDDGLFWQQVDKGVAGQVGGVVTDAGVAGPGGKLGKDAGGAGVENAVADDLHVLVDVAVKHAAQPVTGGQEGLVQIGAVNDQHVGIHPSGVHGQGGKVHEEGERGAVGGGLLAHPIKLGLGQQPVGVEFVRGAGIEDEALVPFNGEAVGVLGGGVVGEGFVGTHGQKVLDVAGVVVVAGDVVDGHLQGGKGFGGELIGTAVWLRHHIPRMHHKIRPHRQLIDNVNNTLGTRKGTVAVPLIIGRWANMGITNMNKINRLLGFHLLFQYSNKNKHTYSDPKGFELDLSTAKHRKTLRVLENLNSYKKTMPARLNCWHCG